MKYVAHHIPQRYTSGCFFNADHSFYLHCDCVLIEQVPDSFFGSSHQYGSAKFRTPGLVRFPWNDVLYLRLADGSESRILWVESQFAPYDRELTIRFSIDGLLVDFAAIPTRQARA